MALRQALHVAFSELFEYQKLLSQECHALRRRKQPGAGATWMEPGVRRCPRGGSRSWFCGIPDLEGTGRWMMDDELLVMGIYMHLQLQQTIANTI